MHPSLPPSLPPSLQHLTRLTFTGYLSCLMPCASLWSARPLLQQKSLYKQSACDKHYVCFSFSADDKMTLCLQGILWVWNQQRTPRCMLHFDMHCAARKEIHEGIAVTNKRSRTSVNNEGVKSKHRAQPSVETKRHTWLRYEEQNTCICMTKLTRLCIPKQELEYYKL